MNNAQLILITFLCTCVSHATASFLHPTGFPNTSNDTTFTERRDNAATGYHPYANRSAYQTISIETEEQYMIRRAEYERQSNLTTMTPAQYCDAYPLDAERCPQSPGLYESVVAIGNRPATTADQEQPHTPTSTLPPSDTNNRTRSYTTCDDSTRTNTDRTYYPHPWFPNRHSRWHQRRWAHRYCQPTHPQWALHVTATQQNIFKQNINLGSIRDIRPRI